MRKRTKNLALLLGGLTSACLFLSWLQSRFDIGIPCLFYHVTGLYCPGCGSTRAAGALVRCDFHQAARYNLFFLIALPFLLLSLGRIAYTHVRYGKQPAVSKVEQSYLIALMVIGILYGILRNIPYFSFLAPTALF